MIFALVYVARGSSYIPVLLSRIQQRKWSEGFSRAQCSVQSSRVGKNIESVDTSVVMGSERAAVDTCHAQGTL